MNYASSYSPAEERMNIASHATGLVLSTAGLLMLIIRSASFAGALEIVSVTVFGSSLVVLYAVSTIYHSTTEPARRARMRTADHAAIYLLIAGTYTPFALLVLPKDVGWVIFGVSWSMAAAGIILKWFYTGRFELASTLMYLFMGWIIIFAIKPLIAAFPGPGMAWLVAGGLSYTVGAILYSIKNLPFGHATFHLFVLAGSVAHFVAVYSYVLEH